MSRRATIHDEPQGSAHIAHEQQTTNVREKGDGTISEKTNHDFIERFGPVLQYFSNLTKRTVRKDVLR